MADRLYTVETGPKGDGIIYIIFDFEERVTRRTQEDPQLHGDITLPPFFVNPETFYGIVNRILELDAINPKKHQFPS